MSLIQYRMNGDKPYFAFLSDDSMSYFSDSFIPDCLFWPDMHEKPPKNMCDILIPKELL